MVSAQSEALQKQVAMLAYGSLRVIMHCDPRQVYKDRQQSAYSSLSSAQKTGNTRIIRLSC